MQLQRATTRRTASRHAERLRVQRTKLARHRDDLRNDIPGALHQDRVTDADVFLAHVSGVVQLCAPDGTGDVQVSQKFIDLASQTSPELQTYIYQHWPRRTKNADGSYSYDYEKLWLRAYTGRWDRSYESREYFNRVVEELHESYPGAEKPVLMVPVGDVLFELDRQIKADNVPGLGDIAELFWDGIHMTNWGGLVIGTTFYATMYRRDPRGLDFRPYEVLDDPWDRKIPEGFARTVQEIAWDVVEGHAYSGV